MATYSQTASRANPGCILFLVDQSFSMTEGLAGSPKAKMEAVTTAVSKLFSELITLCEKGEDKPRHWFDVGLIGYTTDANGVAVVGSMFGGGLAGRELVGIPDLYDNPLALEVRKKKEESVDDTGNIIYIDVEVNFPVWYQAPARERLFGTPMRTAFEHARPVLEGWIAAHPNSFPPMVINLTDGEPTDGDPEDAAAAVRDLATADGNVLVVNCHLSAQKADGVLFPTDEAQLPDEFARSLFRMSSLMPDAMRGEAEKKQISSPSGCRLMAFNADMAKLMKLISVGTSSAGGAGPDARPAHLR